MSVARLLIPILGPHSTVHGPLSTAVPPEPSADLRSLLERGMASWHLPATAKPPGPVGRRPSCQSLRKVRMASSHTLTIVPRVAAKRGGDRGGRRGNPRGIGVALVAQGAVARAAGNPLTRGAPEPGIEADPLRKRSSPRDADARAQPAGLPCISSAASARVWVRTQAPSSAGWLSTTSSTDRTAERAARSGDRTFAVSRSGGGACR